MAKKRNVSLEAMLRILIRSDPYQKVTDPQHCQQGNLKTVSLKQYKIRRESLIYPCMDSCVSFRFTSIFINLSSSNFSSAIF